MDIVVSDEELGLICEALKRLETDDPAGAADERLSEIRKLYQRLHTLHTAK